MEIQELQELNFILKNWKNHLLNKNKILNALNRLSQLKFASIKDVTYTMQIRNKFHKKIHKTENIPDEWFQKSIKLKKYLKKIQQQLRAKEIKKPPSLIKNKTQNLLNSVVQSNEIQQYKHQIHRQNNQIKLKELEINFQQCRFCHQNTAYCNYLTRIRICDSPMSRFMICSNCNKKYND